MLSQEELNKNYVDGPAAAKMLNVTSNQVRFLCSRGKLKGAMKVGTSAWLIPRESVLNYKPGKRGPKPKLTPQEEFKILVKNADSNTSMKVSDNNDKQ